MNLRFVPVAVACLLLTACAVIQGRPGTIGMGAVGGACGEFAYHGDAPDDSVTIDVLILWATTDSAMRAHVWERPVPDQALDTLRAIGARVMYRFQLPYARIRMRNAETARLKGIAEFFRYVPDPTRHDAEVVVQYREGPTDRDVRRFVELGGVMDDRGNSYLSGSMPDASIGRLRREAAVESIEPIGVGCVDL